MPPRQIARREETWRGRRRDRRIGTAGRAWRRRFATKEGRPRKDGRVGSLAELPGGVRSCEAEGRLRPGEAGPKRFPSRSETREVGDGLGQRLSRATLR